MTSCCCIPFGAYASANVSAGGGGGGGFSDFFVVSGITSGDGSTVTANVRVVGAAANRRIFFVFHGFSPEFGSTGPSTLEALTLTFGVSGSTTAATRTFQNSTQASAGGNSTWMNQSAWYLDEANTSGASIPIVLDTSGFTMTSSTTWVVYGWWSSQLNTSTAPTTRTYSSAEVSSVNYGYGVSSGTTFLSAALTTTLYSGNTASAVNAAEIFELVIDNPNARYKTQAIYATAFSNPPDSNIASNWSNGATAKWSILIENEKL